MNMLTDPDRPIIFFGLSGAMIPGGMRRVVRDLIAFHAIDVLVSTGANLSHDLYETLGGRHSMSNTDIDTPTLRPMRLDPVNKSYANHPTCPNPHGFGSNCAASLHPPS